MIPNIKPRQHILKFSLLSNPLDKKADCDQLKESMRDEHSILKQQSGPATTNVQNTGISLLPDLSNTKTN